MTKVTLFYKNEVFSDVNFNITGSNLLVVYEHLTTFMDMMNA